MFILDRLPQNRKLSFTLCFLKNFSRFLVLERGETTTTKRRKFSPEPYYSLSRAKKTLRIKFCLRLVNFDEITDI